MDFREVLDKQAALFAYSQDGYRGALYDKGAAAFAAGQGAMMLQGIWAMAPVLMANPDFHAGMFPYPGGSPDESVVVSGVDLTVTIARDTDHFDQAHRLVEFLFRQDIISAYAASQNMIPSVIGATVPADPVIQDAMAYFDSGRIAGFTDHQVPQSIPLEQIVQGFLLDGDAAKALATLDNEWSKVARRATTRR
jgi:raffinose/stachyose/melibiose transport system substrate-binding protein